MDAEDHRRPSYYEQEISAGIHERGLNPAVSTVCIEGYVKSESTSNIQTVQFR